MESINNHVRYVNERYGYSLELSRYGIFYMLDYGFDNRVFKTPYEVHAFLNGMRFVHDKKCQLLNVKCSKVEVKVADTKYSCGKIECPSHASGNKNNCCSHGDVRACIDVELITEKEQDV